MNKKIDGLEQVNDVLSSSSVILFQCLAEKNMPLIFVSDNVRQLLGFTANELLDNDNLWRNHIHHDDYGKVMNSFDKVTGQKSNKWVSEYRFQRKDGTYIWLRDEIRLVEGDQGESARIVGTSFDITGRKKTDIALAHSQRKYKNVVENINEIIFQTDELGHWTYLNPAWENMTGFSIADSLGNRYDNYLHPDERDKGVRNFQTLINSDDDTHQEIYRLITKEGDVKKMEVLARLHYDNDANVLGATGILTDVTEREKENKRITDRNRTLEQRVAYRTKQFQKTNQELRNEIDRRREIEQTVTEQRDRLLLLEKAISEIEDVVIITKQSDPDLESPKIIYVNEAFERRTGYHKDEILGKTPDFLWGPLIKPEYVESLYNELRKNGVVKNIEVAQKRKNGETYWVTLDIILFFIYDSDSYYSVSISRDITKQKKREQIIKGQYEILEMIARRESLSKILKEIGLFVEKQSIGLKCAILLLNEFKDRFKVGASPFPQEFSDVVENIPIQELGTSYEAVVKKKTIVTKDIASDPSWEKFWKPAQKRGIRSASSTPVFSSRNELLGVFTLYHQNKLEEDEVDTQWINVATNLVSIATEQANEQKKLEKINDNLSNAQRIAKLGSWENDLEREVLRWSDELYEIFEINKSQYIQKNDDFFSLLPDNIRSDLNEMVKEKIKKGEREFTYKFFLKTKDGKEKYLFDHAEIIYNKKGKPVRMKGVIQDITERQKNLRELSKLSMVASKTSNGIYITNESGRIDWFNDAFTKLTGYTSEEIIGKYPVQILRGPETEHQKAKKLDFARENFESLNIVLKGYKKDGSTFWDHIDMSSFADFEGKRGTINVLTDITRLIEYEEELKTSLNEKEVLLTEIHHRVKNNLATISGLMELQIEHSDNDQLRNLLSEGQSRVKSIALIHEKLYHNKTLSKINIAKYISDLNESIRKSFYLEDSKIKVNTNCEDLYLNINQGVPFGLMLNEMFYNAYQHAFVNNKSGNIYIDIQQDKDEINIIFSDDGKGLPQKIDLDHPDSLGFKLILTMTRQLKGNILVDNSNGTKYVVNFPWEKI
ncbi:MAG TPA: PAS domain S-box protein [Balneolales bacterium]|nr:PAS domain S-box protein [Balneolales bacterium]